MQNLVKRVGAALALGAGVFGVHYGYTSATDSRSIVKRVEVVQEVDAPVNAQEAVQNKKVQVVFVLDATGSMAGLIGAAKEKIWSIASSFAQADSTTVEVGLVFYRDKRDEFVTKQIALSQDVDEVYEKLMAIKADGGGDSPESVNQGLYEAVSKMGWNKDTSTFKTVFLVGDQPPHMDYDDDVKYPQTCALAKEKDIILNTILMGNDQTAKNIWKQIAKCSLGDFTQVDMNANNLTVETPYDEKIAELSAQMDDTRLYYGTEEEKKKQATKKVQSQKLKTNLSAATAARRAEYNMDTKSGKDSYLGTKELLNDYKGGKVNVETIQKEKLPNEIASLSPAERKDYLDKLVKRRDSLDVSIKQLISQRKEYVDKELSKRKKEEVESSLDYKIYENVKKQAEKKKINMKGKAKL